MCVCVSGMLSCGSLLTGKILTFSDADLIVLAFGKEETITLSHGLSLKAMVGASLPWQVTSRGQG